MPQMRDYERRMKELQSQSGCEASPFRKFIKICEKVEKKMPAVQNRYETCLATTKQVCALAEQLLEHFTQNAPIDIMEITKSLKKYRNTFDHEFIISSQDREFHATYDHLLVMLPNYVRTHTDRLLTQSEIENLLSPLKEALEKEAPDFFSLTYFLMKRDVNELYEINAERKRTMIRQIVQVECLRPFLNEVRENGANSDIMSEIEILAVEMIGGNPS